MERAVARFCADDRLVCRWVGGALLADLSLGENVLLASSFARGASPTWLGPELAALFEAAGCPLADDWAALPASSATPAALLQARVGRALAADPDWLLVDAQAWPDDVLNPERFTRAFRERYPWRGLAWLCDEPEGGCALQARLSGAER